MDNLFKCSQCQSKMEYLMSKVEYVTKYKEAYPGIGDSLLDKSLNFVVYSCPECHHIETFFTNEKG